MTAGSESAASCAVHDAEGARVDRLRPSPSGGSIWTPLPGDVLRCSHPGYEPIDVEAGPSGLPARIERGLSPARTVTLVSEGPAIDAVIEWRGAGEAAAPAIARRRVRLQDRLDLPVAQADRLLRVCPNGLSPTSLFVPAGASSFVLRVPPSRPGGELYGVLPARAFVPVAVELSGHGATLAIELDTRRAFQASGLAPGTYTLVARYRGGLHGRARRVDIHARQTTDLVPWPLPEAGAASLVVAPQVCVPEHLPARLWLQRVDAEGAAEPSRIDLSVPPCERDLEGLEEGTYEASFRNVRSREAVGVARFEVRPGQKTEARLASAPVRVKGRLTLGDQPAPGFALVFENDGQTWTARSDEDGAYRTALGPVGEYRISIEARADVAAASFVRRFEAGEQAADFALAAGGLHLRVVRDDAAPLEEEVQLTLTSSSGRSLSASLRPGEGGEKRFLGLEPGEYWVTGRTPAGLVSQGGAPVSLTAEQPWAEVDLVLGRHEGLLEVLDEGGGPLSSAQVQGSEALLAAHHPGAFALREVPMGEWLRIRAPGYLPACRIVRPDDLPAMRVVLRRASESVTVTLEPHLPWDAGLLEAPGSDCPLGMSDLDYEARPERTGTTITLRLPRGRYRLAVGTFTRSVAVR